MPTGFDWNKIKKLMEGQGWIRDWDGDGKTRSVYIGTVFNIYPSGKYYTPFACSNLALCPICDGRGHTFRPRRRFRKRDYERAKTRLLNLENLFEKLYTDQGISIPLVQYRKIVHLRNRINRLSPFRECSYCLGCGSREAYLDTLFQEMLDNEAAENGFFITGGEGDPCDVLVCEFADLDEGEAELLESS